MNFLLSQAPNGRGKKIRSTKLKIRISTLLFISSLLFLLPYLSAAYTFETWTAEEGLPQNSILCLLQDKTGYLWFGTQSGLVRFDGVYFRVYNRWNTPALKEDKITAIYEDGSGFLWIGTDSGLCRMKNNEWTSFTTKEGLTHNAIHVFYEDQEGNLLIGTANGLNRLVRGKDKFESLTAETGADFWGNTINAITRSANATIWIGTHNNGLYFLKNGKYQSYKPSGEAIDGSIMTLSEAPSGGLWLGTQNGLLLLENNKIRRPAPPNHPLSYNAIRALFLDKSGITWIGTEGEGIFQFKNNNFSTVTCSPELSNDYIYAFLEDRETNIWVGTFTGGLTRLNPTRVTTVIPGSTLSQNLVRVLMEDKNQCLWVGLDRKGLLKIKDNKIIGDILPIPGITALYQDNDNKLWVGTRQNGLMRYRQDNMQVRPDIYTTQEGLSCSEITAIRGDKEGNTWIGTTNGLNKFEKGKFTVYALAKNKNYPYIKTIEIKENNSSSTIVWLGTTQGLLRLNGDHLEEVIIPSDERKFLAADIQCLYADNRDNLWIGTNGSGLGKLSKDRLYVYDTNSGLTNNYIFSILEDKQNNLWMSSYKGVFRVAIEQIENLSQKKIQSLTPLYLDEKDGMPGSECVKDGHPPACKTASGKLFFPTVKGAVAIDPDLIKLNKNVPPVIIEEVLINNKHITNRVNPVFPPGKNIMEFYFTALSFTSPGKVKLQYKMEGFDPRWIDVAPRQKRAALYVNLEPGNYRFLVTASNSDGLWNEKGAAFAFKIRYPFYKQPFFYLLIMILLTAAIIIGYRQFYQKKAQAMIIKPGEPKYKTSALLPETVEEVLPRLIQLMEKEKVFLKADINLKSLAQRLNVHYNYLSQIINEKLNHSFNDFINSYRIEEAKKKLLAPGENDKTILDIAYDTGFYSKSVFNTAFKKFTGMTPSEFKKINK
ncbi:MAG: helix-turn-helix domain-containing protein [Acidobacteria bacterium]|jgi:ligand-binding sensor domain-containing protein/AraC-like DNA-binding protein|nr:helix-turn-helix domain-containing protein [Acidobacteriota bacterium]